MPTTNITDKDNMRIQGNKAHPIIVSAKNRFIPNVNNMVWIHIDRNIHNGIYFKHIIANLYLVVFLILLLYILLM